MIFLKKIGINKRNPNPPWPSEQPVVVIPPGSNAASVGMPESPVRRMTEYDDGLNGNMNGQEREFPIMGFPNPQDSMMSGGCMNSVSVNGYLCGHTGKYVKIEFIFGEQTHIEKTGILRSVGQNFVVVREMGSENDIVCAINKIKFITIYNMNDGTAQSER